MDRIEGFAIDAAGTGWVNTDNDGVDDSAGESLFWSIGRAEQALVGTKSPPGYGVPGLFHPLGLGGG